MISIGAVLAVRGELVVGRSNNTAVMVLCVFHAEKTPSLRIWHTGRFYCHGCQAGDLADLVGHCLGESREEAMGRLADGYWLPSVDDTPLRRHRGLG